MRPTPAARPVSRPVAGSALRGAVRRVTRRARLPLLLPALLIGLAPLVAGADVRVLLAFDQSGHRVHDIRRGGDADAALTSYVAPPADLAAAARAGDATLAWLGPDGRVLLLERAPDPRVGHAPAPAGNGVAVSPGAPVALAEGGWLARGPEAATTLVLRLPAVGAPALAAEEWRLALDEEGSPGR